MNTNTFNLLNTELFKINFSLTPQQLTQFETYAAELVAYNAHTNLISREIKGEDEIIQRHFLDSLSLIEFWQELNGKPSLHLADIGTGGGFPGLCLAIAQENLKVVLIDSVAKKTEFLKNLVAKLELSHRVKVLTDRAEELGHHPKFRGKFQIVTSRALSAMPVVAELGLPLLEQGGNLVTYKSRAGLAEELSSAQALVGQMGGGKPFIQIPSIANQEKNHCLVFLPKKSATPEQFPRPWAKISKNKKRN